MYHVQPYIMNLESCGGDLVSKSIKDIKGFNALDDNLQDLFIYTYNKHYRANGSDSRKKLTIDKIKEIKVNYKEMCIEVYFNHEWFKYFPNLTWG